MNVDTAVLGCLVKQSSTAFPLAGEAFTVHLAILPVQQIPHCSPPSLICFTQRLALVGVHAALSRGDTFVGAALRTAVREARLIRLQFELFFANAADFDWESHSMLHNTSIIMR
jgi:hypothetical protein